MSYALYIQSDSFYASYSNLNIKQSCEYLMKNSKLYYKLGV